jgi:hypothetical protein
MRQQFWGEGVVIREERDEFTHGEFDPAIRSASLTSALYPQITRHRPEGIYNGTDLSFILRSVIDYDNLNSVERLAQQ